MNVLIILLPAALLLGLGFLAIFVWSVARGQYDDLETPAQRALLDDSSLKKLERKKLK